MSEEVEEFRHELKRFRRVSDMLCTAHNVERDRYRRRSTWLDILLMLTSLYLVSMAFVDPMIAPYLTPPALTPALWTGLLAILVFAFSVVQLIVNWKGKADAHERSFRLYAEAKSNCTELLETNGPISREAFNRVRARYDMASDIGIHISDHRFLTLKQKHLKKVCISKDLDNAPFMSIRLVLFKLWFRDTFLRAKKQGGHSDDVSST